MMLFYKQDQDQDQGQLSPHSCPAGAGLSSRGQYSVSVGHCVHRLQEVSDPQQTPEMTCGPCRTTLIQLVLLTPHSTLKTKPSVHLKAEVSRKFLLSPTGLQPGGPGGPAVCWSLSDTSPAHLLASDCWTQRRHRGSEEDVLQDRRIESSSLQTLQQPVHGGLPPLGPPPQDQSGQNRRVRAQTMVGPTAVQGLR